MSIIKRKVRLLDTYKSCLFDGEVKRYKEEITKQKNNPVCKDLSTIEVATKGVVAMKADNFCLLGGQLDV